MPALLETSSSFADDFEMLCAADYPAEEVQWLWPGRIPIGKVTLLVGDPGNGKSLVALDIASRVSRGVSWPDESPAQGLHSLGLAPLPGSVLILSAEDDIRDTIRPRLDAAGADPQRIFILPTVADLRHDLEKLRAALDRLPDCRLIVIDPVNSYVGPGDSHFHTIVRRVFEPLTKLATEKGIAILGISHLRKHDGAAIQRAAGSMGFVAAARAVWTVCRDPVQADRYLMLQVKNNFVAESAGLAYSISSLPSLSSKNIGHEGSSVPVVSWQAEPVTTSAVEALQPDKRSRGPEPTELALAIDYVQRELITGPQSAEYMLAGAMGGGFSDSTVRRALVAIGGKTRKERPYGFGSWIWYLPDHDYKDPELADKPPKPTEPATAPASPLQPAVSPAPDKPTPDPSENLTPSQKNEGSRTETCSLRENTTPPQSIKLPSLLDLDGPDSLPRDEQGLKSPHTTQSGDTLPEVHNYLPIRIYEVGDFAVHPDNFRRSRSLPRPKPKHRRVHINLIKPYTFMHPTRCRAP